MQHARSRACAYIQTRTSLLEHLPFAFDKLFLSRTALRRKWCACDVVRRAADQGSSKCWQTGKGQEAATKHMARTRRISSRSLRIESSVRSRSSSSSRRSRSCRARVRSPIIRERRTCAWSMQSVASEYAKRCSSLLMLACLRAHTQASVLACVSVSIRMSHRRRGQKDTRHPAGRV